MKLDCPGDWLDLVNKLRDQGAVLVEIETHPDGGMKALKCSLRPPGLTMSAPPRKPAGEDEGKPQPKPKPAGLGYM